MKFLLSIPLLFSVAFGTIHPFSFNVKDKKTSECVTLFARPVQSVEDKPFFDLTYGNPTAMKSYMNGIVRPDEEIIRRLTWAIDQKDSPWTVWLFFNEQSEFVGLIKLEPTDRKGRPYETEVSYVLNPIFWGRGYCVAGLAELISKMKTIWKDVPIQAEYDQGKTPVTQLYATANPMNKSSCSVLEANDFEIESIKQNFVSTLRIEGHDAIDYGDARRIYVRKL